MIAYAFYGVAIIVALSALRQEWRGAVVLCLALDVVRDPVRKLAEGEPVLITLVGAAVWIPVTIAALTHDRSRIDELLRQFPKLRNVLSLFILALLPGMVVTLTTYSLPASLGLIAIGTIAYIGPIIGILLGVMYVRDERDCMRFMWAYTLINGIAMLGTFAEHAGLESPLFGGLRDFDWKRTQSGVDAIALRCGIYRSPDLLGLHAAHVAMFGTLIGAAGLAYRRRSARVIAPLIFAGMGLVALILSARRKMIAMPIVFAVVLGFYVIRHGSPLLRRTFVILLAVAFAVLVVSASFSWIESHTLDYAGSIAGQGVERVEKGVLGSAIETVRQNGMFGYGLGRGTQGAHYFNVRHGRVWQEDGLGRAFGELGVPGVLMLVFAAMVLMRVVANAMRRGTASGQDHMLRWGLLGVAAANLVSFSVSHQAYSGDPASQMIAAITGGMVIGLAVRSSHAANLPVANVDYERGLTSYHRS